MTRLELTEIHIPCRLKLLDHGSTVDWHVGHCCSGSNNDNHEILSTLQDDSSVIVPALDAALLYSGLPPLPALQAPSAEGTRIALTPVSSNGTPIPWYQGYNPAEMLAQHSIVSVALALNSRLTQLQVGPNGGTGP